MIVLGVVGSTSGWVLWTVWSGVPAGGGTRLREYSSTPGAPPPCDGDPWPLPQPPPPCGGKALLSVVLWTRISCSTTLWLAGALSISDWVCARACAERFDCCWACPWAFLAASLATSQDTEDDGCLLESEVLKSITRAWGELKGSGDGGITKGSSSSSITMGFSAFIPKFSTVRSNVVVSGTALSKFPPLLKSKASWNTTV